MSSNKLYNFVHTIFFKNDRQKVDKATLFQQTHLNGTSYYLLQLPKRKNKFPEGLTLTEHHISIYESPLNTIDKKSEYHYTATFMDEQKKSYRIHVYFDQFDELVSPPQLALETGGQQYVPIDGDEFDIDWLALSQKAIKSVVTQLRLEQDKHCILLKNEIEPLEKRALQLSADLPKSKKQYLTTLDQQIELSTRLNAINSKEDKHKQIALLKTIYQGVESQIPSRRVASKKTPLKASPSPKLLKTDHSNGEKEVTSLKKQGKTSTKKKVKEEQFDPKVKKLSGELLKIGSITNEQEKTLFIQTLFQQVSELQLIIPTSESDLIQILNKMEQSILTIGRKHLHLLLSKNKFEEAALLRALFPLTLDDSLLNRALADLNADLLDFLLINGNYTLDPFEPKINKKTYGSIMEYLFQSDLESPKVAQCFDILLNHKMSLLRSNSDGVPFILPLIEDEDHPLTRTLVQHINHSTENLRLLKLTMDYFRSQIKNCATNTSQYGRISNALVVMNKLYMDTNKEFQLKKQPFEEDLFSRLNSLLEQSEKIVKGLSKAAAGLIIISEAQAVRKSAQASDIYGGLGMFKLDLSTESSTQEELSIMQSKTYE